MNDRETQTDKEIMDGGGVTLLEKQAQTPIHQGQKGKADILLPGEQDGRGGGGGEGSGLRPRLKHLATI